MIRAILEIEVFRGDFNSDRFPPRMNAAAFQAWLASQLATIPPDHASTAEVMLDFENDRYGDCWPVMVITYNRPETDDEMADRLQRSEIAQSRERARLKAALARLGPEQ